MSSDSQTWLPEDGAVAETGGAAERYLLLERLGAGGMGEVWRALDRELGRTVALKVLRPELSARQAGRFLNEARATAQLEHRGIVPVHDVGRLPDGRLFYAMQEIRGDTFASAIAAVHAASGAGPWRAAPDGRTFLALVAIFEDVCDTLAYAHARGLLHRDLKPENVMLGAFGEVHVVDWGLVKRIGTSDPGEPEPAPALAPGNTQIGQVAGTMGYMSPEQLAGRVDDLGRTSDVWSLGAILHQVLVGGPPPASGPSILDDPRLPAELVAICRRALDRDPSRRHPDAGALAAEVRRWREEETVRSVRHARIAAAERAFLGLDPGPRERVRELLLWLVDADGRAVPRRVADVDGGTAAAVVGAGLAVARGDALHLVEPELLDWERLRGWVEADRAGQRLRHALRAAAAAWEAGGGRASHLWGGERLAEARRWRRAGAPWLPGPELRFLEASDRAERRRQRLAGAAALAVGLGLALAAVVATLAWQRAERALAREQVARREAVARGLAAEAARRELADQPHLAMVFEAARTALTGEPAARVDWLGARHGGLHLGPADPEAMRLVPGPAARGAFRIVGSRLTRLDPDTGAERWSAETGLPGLLWADGSFSPRLVLASDPAGTLVTLDGVTGAVLGRYDGLTSLSLYNAVDPTGQFVASTLFDGTVDLWEARAGVRAGRIALGEVGPSVVAFSPDGLTLVAHTAVSTARWTPPALRRQVRADCPSTSAIPSPDRRSLLLSGGAVPCRVDLVGGEGARPLPVAARLWTREGELWSPGDADGGRAVPYGGASTGGRELDDPVRGWLLQDVAGPFRRTPAGERVGLPEGTPVAAAGRWLLSADTDAVRVVDLLDGSVRARLPAEVRPRLLAEVAVWGDRVVAGQADGTVAVWGLPAEPGGAASAPEARLGAGPTPVSLVVGAGDRLLVGRGDGSFAVYDAELRPVAAGQAGDDLVTALALDPTGERLLVGVGHAAFAVWHLPTARVIVAVSRERRGLLHSVGWTAAGEVWGAGADGVWTWAVPPAPAPPLGRTNLRLCEDSLRVVPVDGAPVDSPWAGAEVAGCGEPGALPPGPVAGGAAG